MRTCILAIDQGTTATKVLVMNTQLEVLRSASVPFEQHFPAPGQVEHRGEQIWASVVEGIQRVTKDLNVQDIGCIGITNQRETVVFWDKQTGIPLGPAIVWQDRRTAKECEALPEAWFRERTGLLMDPYFSGTKISWALKHLPPVREAHKAGRLRFGTVDCFLLHCMTAGKVYRTEPSNASRTLAFDIHTLRYDPELAKALGIVDVEWPEVLPSMGTFGETSAVPGLPDGIPITGMLGDQQSALLGQACVTTGSGKCTFGTGAFLLTHTGSKPVIGKHRLLATVAWQSPTTGVAYALEGSAFVAGSAIQWFRDQLGLAQSTAEVEALAASVPHSDGVVFVPALTGLGSPYWRPDVRGQFTGLTRGTTKAHMARAILEGICFQNRDLVRTMEEELGHPIHHLRVDGGASKSDLLMQLQADILGKPLERPKNVETTSQGAVFAAGMGYGIWQNFEELARVKAIERTFVPEWHSDLRQEAWDTWSKAIKKILVT